MKDPQNLSNEEIYCQILTNYYNINAEHIFGASANSFLFGRLHYYYMFNFEEPQYTCTFWDKDDNRCDMLKRLGTFRLEAEPVIELRVDDSSILHFKFNYLLFLTADEYSIISQWDQYNITLSEMPYNEYLQTPHWKHLREQAIHTAKAKCQLCYKNNGSFHVHHRTYTRRGNENPNDLIVLCAACHSKFHDKLPVKGSGN